MSLKQESIRSPTNPLFIGTSRCEPDITTVRRERVKLPWARARLWCVEAWTWNASSPVFWTEVIGIVARDETKTALINNRGQTVNVPVRVFTKLRHKDGCEWFERGWDCTTLAFIKFNDCWLLVTISGAQLLLCFPSRPFIRWIYELNKLKKISAKRQNSCF